MSRSYSARARLLLLFASAHSYLRWLAAHVISQVLSNAAKRRQYDAGQSFSDLVAGFWQTLAKRMQGKQKGVVVSTGSGISLKELAKQEEAETGIKPSVFMLGAAEE